MSLTTAPRSRLPDVTLTPFSEAMSPMGQAAIAAPASGAFAAANAQMMLQPIYLTEPYPVAKAFSCSGATVGRDSWDLGVYRMSDPVTGRCDLIRSTGPVICNFPSVVQEAGLPQVTAVNVTAAGSSTDATTYTTGIVNLSAGKMYLMSVVNTAANAAAVTSIDNGPTFTSRSTTQFNTTALRVSIWSAVAASNYTGTLVINFGAATQTGCVYSLAELSGVDTATNDGIVQQAVGTGSSVTPLATLAAFSSVYNATFGAQGHGSTNASSPKAQFTELNDTTAATPAQSLSTEWFVGNDVAVNATITTTTWGACAVEVKAATAPASPWRVACAQLTSGNDSTDSATYATASVVLKAGWLYLMAVENSAASAAVVSSITGSWTSRASTQFNGTANRISLWTTVPTVDATGALTITFGGAQTGCTWSLLECSGVDTATDHGIVQSAVATGNTANPSVGLAAFGTAANATFAAFGNVASAHTPAPGWTEMADVTAATPAQFMETQWRVDPARNASAVVTSGQWGALAVEIKADASALVIPASQPGNPAIYWAMTVSALAGTFLRSPIVGTSWGQLTLASAFPLPSSCVPTGITSFSFPRPLAGFSLRSLIG
jgi:hypothetical protein